MLRPLQLGPCPISAEAKEPEDSLTGCHLMCSSSRADLKEFAVDLCF